LKVDRWGWKGIKIIRGARLNDYDGLTRLLVSRFFSLAELVLYVLSPPFSFTPPVFPHWRFESSSSSLSWMTKYSPLSPARFLRPRSPNTRLCRLLGFFARARLRSLSWNGNEPSLISTAWERHAGGDIAVHQWKGLGKGGLNRWEDWVEVSAANADAGEGVGVGDDGRA
jgi:WD repeat-containing protein 23